VTVTRTAATTATGVIAAARHQPAGAEAATRLSLVVGAATLAAPFAVLLEAAAIVTVAITMVTGGVVAHTSRKVFMLTRV
jgi:hypothetical protein